MNVEPRATVSATALAEAAFTDKRRGDWQALEALTQRAQTRRIRKLDPEEVRRLAPLYRDTCADLSRAQASHYSAALVDYLQALSASAHGVLYSAPAKGRIAQRARAHAHAVWVAFPRAVRRHWRSMAIAFLLFFVPFFGGFVGAWVDPTYAFKIAPEPMLRQLTESYRQGFSTGRDAGQDTFMAGFYVYNNVGIALRCFALGVLGGLGSAVYLVYNGLATGAIMGYVASQGAGDNILTFVVGHSTFELGAIVIAGGAGLSLGWSMVSPGRVTRIASLQAVAKDLVVIVSGAAFMLLLAALIEGYWSASGLSSTLKRSIGGAFFVTILAYLALVGREADGGAEGAR